MRVLVTGGAGFIGSHVCDLLVARGDDVIVFDLLTTGKRENVPEGAKLIERDIRSKTAVEEIVEHYRPEAVIHLAAAVNVRASVEYPGSDAFTNVVGTANVLQAAAYVGARVILASSGGAIYGECSARARENDQAIPLSPYGAGKLAAEQYLWTYSRMHNSPGIALRYGNVYGPRQDPSGEAGVVAIFLDALGRDAEAVIYGPGGASRDFVYVEDVADATVAALDSHGHGVLNIGTGWDTNVNTLWALCCRAAGYTGRVRRTKARPGEVQRSVLDPSLALETIGWEPTVRLEDGLHATWVSMLVAA